MKGLLKMGSKKSLVILPFVLTFVLIANVTSVKAQIFDYVVLAENQTATVSVSQEFPIGICHLSQ